jgi:hypothetical protein
MIDPNKIQQVTRLGSDIYFDGLLNKLSIYDCSVWQKCW